MGTILKLIDSSQIKFIGLIHCNGIPKYYNLCYTTDLLSAIENFPNQQNESPQEEETPLNFQRQSVLNSEPTSISDHLYRCLSAQRQPGGARS